MCAVAKTLLTTDILLFIMFSIYLPCYQPSLIDLLPHMNILHVPVVMAQYGCVCQYLV